MQKRALAIAIGLWAASLSASAQQTPPVRELTLDQAIAAALTHDPQYQAAVAARDSGIEKENLGLAGLLPTLNAVLTKYPDASTKSRIPKSLIESQRDWTTNDYDYQTRSITLRQPLIRLRNWAAYFQGKSFAEQAEAQLQFDRTQAISRIIEAYGNWLALEKRVTAAEANVRFMAQRATQIKSMRANGQASLTDELQAQAEEQKARHELAEYFREFAFVSERFSHLVGGSAKPAGLSITPNPESLKPGVGFDDLKLKVLRQNPEIKALERAVEAAKWDVKKYQADHLPTLDFVANYAEEDNATAVVLGRETRTTTMGFQLNIPIYQGGSVNAASRQAAADLRKNQAELTASQFRVTNDLAKVYASLNSAQQLYAYSQQQLKFAQENLKSVTDQQRLGFKTSVDALKAQELVESSLAEQATAKASWMMAKASLLALSGEISQLEAQALERLFTLP